MNKRFFNGFSMVMVSAVTLSAAPMMVMSRVSHAAVPSDGPVLLAQEVNGRIATLHCGNYDITIRFVGFAGSDQFSYQTHGLTLTNGVRDGETYHFFNNDFEYRVVTRSGGSGSLTVLKYGETVMSKSCTWR